MKEKIKLILSSVAGFLIGGTCVLAGNATLNAILNKEVKIIINGTPVTITDEKTNETLYPITYNDRTYLPVRNLSNIFNKNIGYDVDENAVEIGLANKVINVYDKCEIVNDKADNLTIIFDYMDDIVTGHHLDKKYFDNAIYNSTNPLIEEFNNTAIKLAKENPNKKYVTYIVKSAIDEHKEYNLYMSLFEGDEILVTDDVITYMTDENNFTGMSIYIPLHDTFEEFKIGNDFAGEYYSVKAIGKLYSVKAIEGKQAIDTIERRYPGET